MHVLLGIKHPVQPFHMSNSNSVTAPSTYIKAFNWNYDLTKIILGKITTVYCRGGLRDRRWLGVKPVYNNNPLAPDRPVS